ncbi:MAG: glycoside hydrolase family 130 protein [Phycisphaerae bacterium]|nr:glycoside hydrolase family 130 protein [Phycisphaerae bacterium]
MTLVAGEAVNAGPDVLPAWAMGPFDRPENPQPVIRPNADSRFFCPMRKTQMAWQARHTFNPAAVVKDGRIYVLYRAEDDSSQGGIGSFTSRIGLAVSRDGLHFTTEPAPVLCPGEDGQKAYEWYGGCEDPRIAERPDGMYVVLYTQYARDRKGGIRLGLATSRDLRTWTKHGSPFAGTRYKELAIKSASIVHEIRDGRLKAARVNGKYWLYFGELAVNIATSEDLIHWTPLEASPGKLLEVMKTRPGYFDSHLTEVGPQLLLTDHGIVLLYNGKNHGDKALADPSLPLGVYTCGQALFDANDPTRLIARLDRPFFKPEVDWEKTGQYKDGTTFIEGLVLFKGQWFLYYGCADTFVGVTLAQGPVEH